MKKKEIVLYKFLH